MSVSICEENPECITKLKLNIYNENNRTLRRVKLDTNS